MSSCDRIGVAPAMDMPEVLKSLLEHSLPWPEKRTGRNGGGLGWLAAPVPEGWGQSQARWRDGQLPARGLPWAPFLGRRRAGCREGESGEPPLQLRGCLLGLWAPGALASVRPLTGAVLTWGMGRTRALCWEKH